MDDILLDDILNNKARHEKISVPKSFSSRRHSTIVNLPDTRKHYKLHKTMLQAAIFAVIVTSLIFSALYIKGNGESLLMSIRNITFNEAKDKSILNVLYPIVGENKQVVLNKLNIENAEVKTIGTEEYYSIKTGETTVSFIFTNGLCSGYTRTFKDTEDTKNELQATMKKLDKLYGSSLTSMVSDYKIKNFIESTDGIKSMKTNDRYLEEWKLPQNPEREKILLGERKNEFNGLNIQLSLLKQDEDYLVTVKYTANRNK